jgi:hypothetical protein
MLPGMKKALVLIGCLALAGCEGFDHEAGMRALGGYARAGGFQPAPVWQVPQPSMVTCNRFGNTVQCF